MFIFSVMDIVEIVVFLVIGAPIAVALIKIYAKEYFKQKKCKHKEFYQGKNANRANCKECDKDLGDYFEVKEAYENDHRTN